MFARGLGMAAPAVAQGQTPGQPQMPSQNRSGQPVDLDLVLLADSTGSIDDREIFFQRQGYADAITDPDILSALALGPDQKIAVTYVEWGTETNGREPVWNTSPQAHTLIPLPPGKKK